MNGLPKVFGVYLLYVVTFVTLAVLFGGFEALLLFFLYFLLCLLIALIQFPTLRGNLRVVEQRGRKGYLYAFSDRFSLLTSIKVGRETVQGSRLKQHKTAAPWGMRIWFSFPVPDAVAAEAFLHWRWRRTRIRSNSEWFYLTIPIFCEVMLLRIFGA